VSAESALRRAFSKRAIVPVTLLDLSRDESGEIIRTGRLKATAKATLLPVANIYCVWGEHRRDYRQSPAGAEQQGETFAQFLPLPELSIRPEMKVLRGHFKLSDDWSDQPVWEIVTFGPACEIGHYFVIQLDLKKVMAGGAGG